MNPAMITAEGDAMAGEEAGLHRLRRAPPLRASDATHRRSRDYDHSAHGQQQAPVLIYWWDGVGDGAQTLLMSPSSLVRLCRCIC